MMNEDTQNYSAEQMQAKRQKLGSSMSVYSGFDGITLRLQSLTRNLDKNLKLFEEQLLRPKFTEEAFSRIQKQSVEGFKQRKSQPASIADDVFPLINYGTTIFGSSQNGTEYTVKNLSLKNVEDYYNNYMTSRNAKLVVVGDVTENDILGKLGFLNKLPNKEVKLPPNPAFPKADKTKVYVIDIPKATRQVRVGAIKDLKYDEPENTTGLHWQTTPWVAISIAVST